MNQNDINKITISVLRGLSRSFTKAKDLFIAKRGLLSGPAAEIVGTCAKAFDVVAANIEETNAKE